MADYLVFIIPGVMAAFTLWAANQALQKARSIDNTPTSKIRSAPQGYVELVGIAKADPERPVFGKLTQSPCVWYRYRIEQYERRGKNASWRRIASGQSEQAIILDDGTGQCWLHAEGADVASIKSQSWRGNERFPSSVQGGIFGSHIGNYRYTEWRIEADDPLYALGDFHSLTPPSRNQLVTEQSKALLAEWKSNYPELLERFDRDGSGDIDIQEWDTARRQAQRQAGEQVDQSRRPQTVHIMRASQHKHQPYLIANREPDRLSNRYRWQAFGFLLAGCLIIAIVTQHLWQTTI